MKKAINTLFQPQSWMLTLMVVFVWCGLSLQTAQAQIAIKYDSKGKTTSAAAKIDDCKGSPSESSTRFTDDGGHDGLYGDGHARRDTIEICPKDQWHSLKVVFTDFDLATGDTLFAFNANRKTLRDYVANGGNLGTGSGSLLGAGTGAGVGVAKAFGGWIDASCNPALNPSGCLTFIFKTNGDNSKGTGWDAWVDCAKRDIKFGKVDLADTRLQCGQFFTNNAITVPTVEACGQALGLGSDALKVRIRNQRDELCYAAVHRPGDVLNRNFAIGQYTVEFKLDADSTKTTGKKPFFVQAPALVCNDEITAPLGTACLVRLEPDDILEQPCDTIPGVMYYNITVTLGEGKKQKVLKTTGHDNGGAVTYPEITIADIKAAGMKVCDAVAKVEIERIYYGLGMPAVVSAPIGCNNGVQSTTCDMDLRFSDLSKPVINVTFNAEAIVACDTTGLASILGATATDNCDDDVEVTFSVEMDELTPCFDQNGSTDTTQATVTFYAEDDCGNVGTATRRVTIIRPNEDHLVKTPAVTSVECTEDVNIPRPGLAIGRIENGNFIPTDTVELSETEYVCGYILYSEEVELSANDCGRKLYRYYDLVDWCTSGDGNKRIDTAYIEYTDKTAPEFQGEVADKEMASAIIELGANECTYDITQYQAPVATDNCDENPVELIDSIFRIEDGTLWGVPASEFTKLDCDSFKIRWIARDACHEQLKEDTTYQLVEIKDVTRPSAVCTDEIIVSVPGDEGARVEVGEIDAGSWDACGIETRELRRKGTDDAWADHIIITCEDVHNEVLVELRVTDKKGNSNICWLTITAEDKISPICHDLEDKYLTCKDLHSGELGTSTDTDGDGEMEDDEWQPLTGDLMELYNTRFGSPSCEDNLSCGDLTIEQEYQLIEGECGALTAVRRYRAVDWKPNASTWAEQRITVTYVPDWKLSFPADVELTCNDTEIPAAWTPEQVITNGSCDLWSLAVKEKTFEVPGEICMKIERTYHLINDCVGTPEDDVLVVPNNPEGTMVTEEGNETVGRVKYTQVIKLYITEAPTVEIHDVNTCIVGVNDAAPYGEEDNTPDATPYECDTIRTFTASATNCVGAALTDFEWKFYADGVQVDAGTGASFDQIVSPKVNYTVEFWASDGCGNSSGETRDFEFWDCKKPTPYLLNGVAVELGETGMVDVWATDLDRGSFDNCTDQNNLEMYIGLGEPNVGPTTLEGVRALGKTVKLGCTNVGTQSVSIYVVDEEGNWDVAGTYVLVQDNMNACTDSGEGMVAGNIVTPNGEQVEQVSVAISGASQAAMVTGTDGRFYFDLAKNADYTITPVKDMNPLNGVSTFDLVLISKHILGITTFDSPYKHIAADVNKSGTITAFDMVQLRQLILNITTEFPNNDSWRFVNNQHQFTTTNPESENFSEFANISNLSANSLNNDFTGVKVGDINGSAASNSLMSAEARTISGVMNLNVQDRFVEAGQVVSIDFKSSDMATTEGYQFTLNHAGLELVELGEGVAKAANFNTNLTKRGVIATSWNGEATADDVLFTLTMKATTSGMLSELISVSSDLTSAEAYNTTGELLDVNIEFAATVSAAFELGQNSPNPFNGETVIGFNLPKAGTATLKVMDVQGKVLKSIKGEFVKGYNQVTLKANELGATGVLHYQLESADNVATKKMIIIE